MEAGNKIVKDKQYRVYLNADLIKRFKIICVQNDLSTQKQFTELVRKFVETQEANQERLKKK